MDSSHIEKTQLDLLMPLIEEKLAAGHCVRFTPSGTSMYPMLREGIDSVVLSPLPPKLKKFDLPLYKRSSGQYVLHRIVQTGDTYTCIGDNQFYKESGIQQDQMIALVTSFVRNTKEIQTRRFGYQMYCRVWHYSRPIRHLFIRGAHWLWRHIRK